MSAALIAGVGSMAALGLIKKGSVTDEMSVRLTGAKKKWHVRLAGFATKYAVPGLNLTTKSIASGWLRGEMQHEGTKGHKAGH
jgi:hypothetical protein